MWGVCVGVNKVSVCMHRGEQSKQVYVGVSKVSMCVCVGGGEASMPRRARN